MKPQPTIHVLANGRQSLGRALSAALRDIATVRLCDAKLDWHGIAPDDAVVVDLAAYLPALHADELPLLPGRAPIWLVSPEGPIGPQWAWLSTHPAVRLVRCTRMQRAEGFPPIVGALVGRIAGPSSDELARLVLEREPSLQPLGDYIRVICDHPWEVRRLRELAAGSRATARKVRDRCRGLGFTRVEHFLVCVRAVAYEAALASGKLAPALARRLAGVDDPSNFRRQMERARQRSPEAARRIAALGGGG